MTQRRTTPPTWAEVREDKIMRRLIRKSGRDGPVTACLEDASLAALADGRMPAREREEILAHLAECEACLETYSLLCALKGKGETRPGRKRLAWKPMALAASLALAILSLFLLDPRGRDLAPQVQPSPVAAPVAEPLAKAEEKPKPEPLAGAVPPGRRTVPDTLAEQEETKERDSLKSKKAFADSGHTPRESASASIQGDKDLKARGKEKRKGKPIGRLRNLPREAQVKIAARPNAGLQVSGIQLPTPPPGTAPGRIIVILVLGKDGIPEEIKVEPPDSSLAIWIRRGIAKRRFTPCSLTPRRMQFAADWDGRTWRIHSCSPPDGGVSAP